MHPSLRTALVSILAVASPGYSEIQLLGIGLLPGTTSDLSGLHGKTSEGVPRNRLGGHGSAIAYTGKGNSYILASDQGPKDKTGDFACRVHWMDITVTPGQPNPVEFKLIRTTMLVNEAGRSFVGTASAFDRKKPERSMRLDPEGLRVGPAGTLFVADEFGPSVIEFDANGKRLRTLPVPLKFQPTVLGAHPEDELPPKNTRGRQPNRGFEGLAISPDGRTLFALLQNPLIQDSALDKDLKRIGHNCRLLELDTTSCKTREFVYPLNHAGDGLNEILAISRTLFLVLERDGSAGLDVKHKKIYLADFAGATDVSERDSLNPKKLPADIRPMLKKPFIDLLDKRFGLLGKDCPEKFEGLAFGPDLPDGRRLLLVTVDNDFVAEVPFRVLAFAIDKADLPGFEPQRFSK